MAGVCRNWFHYVEEERSGANGFHDRYGCGYDGSSEEEVGCGGCEGYHEELVRDIMKSL